FAQFAKRIFGIKNDDPMKAATEGIDHFEAFHRSIGCPTRLSEIGIDDTQLDRYADDTLLVAGNAEGQLPGRPAMTKADIVEVLRSAL
ncbi:MAG TPA: iron-containing alcohol dehydrogenase, partial [Chlorobaculum parvum]|nr:iron-containing alcohol dehydrogenase [Chlorobaculum parvum]